jgi:hypothetical protein
VARSLAPALGFWQEALGEEDLSAVAGRPGRSRRVRPRPGRRGTCSRRRCAFLLFVLSLPLFVRCGTSINNTFIFFLRTRMGFVPFVGPFDGESPRVGAEFVLEGVACLHFCSPFSSAHARVSGAASLGAGRAASQS